MSVLLHRIQKYYSQCIQYIEAIYRVSSLSGPPSILYTTEYVIHQASEFGQAGQLTCAVNTSPDTESHVTWRANGEAIQDGAKYSRSVSSSSEEVMLFYLHVADIQQSDIGSFLCQLSSDYNREDSQEAWIRVDYRKGTCALSAFIVASFVNTLPLLTRYRKGLN